MMLLFFLQIISILFIFVLVEKSVEETLLQDISAWLFSIAIGGNAFSALQHFWVQECLNEELTELVKSSSEWMKVSQPA
jgi:hypothetical protein